MAATQAKGGFGSKFQRSADNGTTYSSIAEIGDINGGDVSKMTDDATHMESPDGFAEKIATGLHEAGPVSFSMAFIDGDTSHALLRADNESGTTAGYYQVLIPGGARALRFRGYVTKIGNAFPMRGKIVHPVEVTITGKPSWVTP